jgi:mono/diheme cytochrome c family protein
MRREALKILRAAIGITAWLSCLLAGCAGIATSDVGKDEYETKCVMCHGVSGRGDGPRALALSIKPADLTMLAKNNGGVFPASRVHEVIDGRLEVAAHGPRLMPVWGDEFLVQETDRPQDVSEETFMQREARVNGRIKALVDYLARLQDMQ